MTYLCKRNVCMVVLAVAAVGTAWSQAAAADPYVYEVISVTNNVPGNKPTVTFAVRNTQTNQFASLRFSDPNPDPAWTTAGARLALHFGWDTRDFNNTNFDPVTFGWLNARGAAYPIPVNALAANVIRNSNGTYTATAPLPIPLTATGTGRVIMEGHPVTATGAAIPIKSAYLNFTITDTSVVDRRQVVDINKCMVCHYSGGIGGRLTLHGENRTENIGVCVMCHNPNQTDIQRRKASDKTDYPVRVGTETYYEQSVDLKRLVHGIHATSAGFREYPLVVIGPQFDAARCQIEGPCTPDYRFLFDARTLTPFPAKLRNCLNCHIDNGTKGTFELPLGSNVLGSTLNTKSVFGDTVPQTVVDANPDNDENISPTAAVCSSCHDKSDVISHMKSTGKASFHTTQADIDSGKVQELCINCHGPGRDKSVRKVHDISSSSSSDD